MFNTLAARNNWIVFFLSVGVCLTLLSAERLAGIEWNFHPDSVTYVNDSERFVRNTVMGGRAIAYLSQMYYFVAYGLSSNVVALISLNVVAFSVTNVLIYGAIKDRVSTRLQFISLLLILFYPYRVHLAVHILKDTLVVLFFVLALLKSRIFIFPLVLITVRTALYLPTFLPKILNVFLVFGALVAYFVDERFVHFVYTQGSMDFSFRSADQVPVLSDVEYGVLIRALVWPMLYLTGGFFLFSPTILMFPLAIAQLISQLAIFSLFNRPVCTLGLYISLALIALVTPGFTTFYRYALPVFTIIPLLFAKYEKK